VNLIHSPRNQGKIVRNESLVHRWRPKGASMKIKMRDFQCGGSIVDVSTKIRAVINFLDITFVWSKIKFKILTCHVQDFRWYIL
jgi:hypothetical protein